MAENSTTLKCGACGHENEPERVYCHNCGQKLDRSLLPPPEAKKDHEDDGAKHRRVKKMMQVGGNKGSVKRDVMTAIKILIFAVIVAALFLFWQKPEGIPDGKNEDIPTRVAGEAWSQLVEFPDSHKLALTEFEVNYYLKSAVKPAAGSVPGVKFERVFVQFHAGPEGTLGTITVTSKRDAWGLPLYSSMTYAPKERDGKVVFDVIGVRFGRLALHPSLKFFGDMAFSGVKKAFDKEIGQAARLKSVLPGDRVVALETKPAE